MYATCAAEMLTFSAVGQSVVPGSQLHGRVTAPGVERRGTFIGGDPPLLFYTCLLFAADVAGESFNPSHRLFSHPVWKFRVVSPLVSLLAVRRMGPVASKIAPD